jgi:hypothetical protein
MFPHCANPNCTASFDSFREGLFFRFRRAQPASEKPVNHHSVEHFWLCKDCSEEYTLEYRDNRSILISLLPVPALPNARTEIAATVERAKPPLPRRSRAKRRPRSSRRVPLKSGGSNPLVILAISPSGNESR